MYVDVEEIENTDPTKVSRLCKIGLLSLFADSRSGALVKNTPVRVIHLLSKNAFVCDKIVRKLYRKKQ